MNPTNPKVDGYIRKNKRWQNELLALRVIALDGPLVEEVKWRAPCYTHDGRNVVMLGAFKDACVLSFPKGALLKDPRKVLEKPGENTQSARVVRFTGVSQIKKLRPTLKAYILEAIEIENAGLKVEFKKNTPQDYPDELVQKFRQHTALKTAFESLTPGRRRGYLLHFSSAKQSKTRSSRIEKCSPRIHEGRGMLDD
ncbi:MAG: hypothetical protein GC164_01945 [Phycisphaera sp.]|nr:hypothetical protein [Phycisphaera sp.]